MEHIRSPTHNIDTRSDVYSLGAVLYELLCGRLPYDVSDTTVIGACRLICEGTPCRPSAISRRLRGDLELIVLKALEKDRQKRYQSAAELADDARRHLYGEPIEARPATAWTRALRWAGRHPISTTVATCLSLAALIVGGTALSTWWYSFEPYEITILDDGRLARLQSRSEWALAEWKTDVRNGISFAEFVDRSEVDGGGQLAILAYSSSFENPFPGHLCAFDPTRGYDTPIWSARVENIDIPRQLSDQGRDASVFGVQRGQIEDIFEEIPGEEIVVSFSAGSWSQRCVRIYDLVGKVRYQFWQDGGIGGLYWMSDARLLVVSGGDEGIKLKAQKEFGVSQAYASVVFAVRPKLDLKSQLYLGDAREDVVIPVWYKFVHPLRTGDLSFEVDVRSPLLGKAPGRFAQVSVSIHTVNGASLSWIIDENGYEEPKTRAVNDTYVQDQASDDPRLPPPKTFQLREDPPPISLEQRNSSG